MSCIETRYGRIVLVLLALVLAAPMVHATILNHGDSLATNPLQAGGAFLATFTSTLNTPGNAPGTMSLNSDSSVSEFNYLRIDGLSGDTNPQLIPQTNTARPATQPAQKSSTRSGNSAFRPDLAPIPEPTSVALMVSGVAFVGSLLARKRKL